MAKYVVPKELVPLLKSRVTRKEVEDMLIGGGYLTIVPPATTVSYGGFKLGVTSNTFLKMGSDGILKLDTATLASYLSTNGYVQSSSLGTAAYKDYTTSISQNSTDLPTSGAVYSAIGAAVSSALHYRGISSTAITDGGTETATIGGTALVAQDGDVVIYSGFEFLWENNVWNKLGDDTSFALKTIQINSGTGLTGGGDLTASRTLSLSSQTQSDIGNGVTAYGWGDHSQAGYALASALGDYLPLSAGSGKALTGHLYFNASSANKYLAWTDGTNTYKALSLNNNGQVLIGEGQRDFSKTTFIEGGYISFRVGVSDNKKSIILDSGAFRPEVANKSITLGISTYPFTAVYATTLYGNLDLSYLQNADDLKAIEALTGTSGFLKKTAANTWALDTAPDASTLNGKTAAEILSGVESLKTTSENDAMFTYRKTPSVAVGDMAKVLKIKGKTIVWNQLIWVPTTASWTDRSIVVTNNGDGSYTLNGTADSMGYLSGFRWNGFRVYTGRKYYVSLLCTRGSISDVTKLSFSPTNAGSGLGVRADNSGIVTTTNAGDPYMAFYVTSGVVLTNYKVWPIMIDLTTEFGSGYEPADVATFEALYGLRYYSYDSGSLQSNKTAAIESVGWNQLNINGRTEDTSTFTHLGKHNFSEDKYIKGYAASDYKVSSNVSNLLIGDNRISFTSSSAAYGVGFPMRCLPNTTYYYKRSGTGSVASALYVGHYDINGVWITSTYSQTFTTPSNCYWIVINFTVGAEGGASVVYTDICINLSNPSRNGEYQPYKKDTLQLNVTDLVPVDKPTVRLNQLLKELVSANWSNESGVSMTDNTGYATIAATTGNHGIYIPFTYQVGHKYYLSFTARSSTALTLRQGTGNSSVYLDGAVPSTNAWTRFVKIATCNATANWFYFYPVSTAATFDLKDIACIDLTEMYGSGNEPTSTAEVEALIGTGYIPYNTGEDIPNRIFPQGERGAGTAFDLAYGNTAEKRMGVVDLGTLSWTLYSAGIFYTNSLSSSLGLKYTNLVCAKYTTNGAIAYSDMPNKSIGSMSGSNYIWVRDDSYADAAAFKSAMNGVWLVYQLSTPVSYTIAPLPQLIASDPDGTQRRLPVDTASSVSAPMVCDFQYGVNPSDIYEEDERKIHETNQSIADTNNAIAEILIQLPSSGKVEIPTDDPVNPDNTKTYIYYDDLTHKICVREKDGTVYSIQLTT